MGEATIDVLMITHRRPAYTRLSLTRLLASCDESMRVWLWHNGTDEETLRTVRELADHERVAELHVSPENKRLREPTNWLWNTARGELLGKVDDDCIVPEDWASKLRAAHRDVPELGAIGCWRFQEEDFVPELAERKIRTFPGGHKLLRNCWVQGSGYLMKRAVVERQGLLQEGESFTQYLIRAARAGWIHGWLFPFLREDHMDDPRSPHTLLRTDADLARFGPLGAQGEGIRTLREWEDRVRWNAIYAQRASLDPRAFTGWRRTLLKLSDRLRGHLGLRYSYARDLERWLPSSRG